MAARKEKQEEQSVQRTQDLERMTELEGRAEEWSRLNQLVNHRPTELSQHERDEMVRRLREIDPCWYTGIGGGMQRTRNEA